MRLNTIKGIVQNYFERCFDFYPDSVGYIDVSDKWMLVTLCWRQFLGVIERISILVTIFWILVFDDNTVTNTSNLSSIHFVSNIRHQYRCSRLCHIWRPLYIEISEWVYSNSMLRRRLICYRCSINHYFETIL